MGTTTTQTHTHTRARARTSCDGYPRQPPFHLIRSRETGQREKQRETLQRTLTYGLQWYKRKTTVSCTRSLRLNPASLIASTYEPRQQTPFSQHRKQLNAAWGKQEDAYRISYLYRQLAKFGSAFDQNNRTSFM